MAITQSQWQQVQNRLNVLNYRGTNNQRLSVNGRSDHHTISALSRFRTVSEFNPLFQSVVILNNDYILVGSGEMILARRIQGSNSE